MTLSAIPLAAVDDRPYTNYSLRTFVLAMKDVMGDKGVTAILRSVGLSKFVDNLPSNNLEPGVNFSDYTRLNVAIEDFSARPKACCNASAGRHSNSVNVGFLEEACAWAVGSSVHVEETRCRGRGDTACEYRITIETR